MIKRSYSLAQYIVPVITTLIISWLSLYRHAPPVILLMIYSLTVIGNVFMLGWKAGIISTALSTMSFGLFLHFRTDLIDADIAYFVLFFMCQGILVSYTARKKVLGETDDEFYARMFNHMPEAIVITDHHKKIRFWNKHAEDLLHIKRREAVSKPFVEVTGFSFDAPHDHIFKSKDKKTRYISTSTSLLTGLRNYKNLYITVMHDITPHIDKMNSLQYLIESSVKITSSLEYGVIIQHIIQCLIPRLGDGCMIYSIEDNIIRNVANRHIMAEKDDLLQLNHTSNLSVKESLSHWREVLDKNAPTVVTDRSKSGLSTFIKSQERFHVLQEIGTKNFIFLPLTVKSQQIGFIILLKTENSIPYTDNDQDEAIILSEQIAMALHNAQLFYDTQEAVRLREEHLSIASHELRTPLTSLLLQLQSVLKSIYRDPLAKLSIERLLNLLKSAQEQSNRLSNLIDSLLDVSRITPGRVDIKPEHIDISLLLKKIIDGFSEQLSRANIELQADTDGPLFGVCDPVKIEQVLANLIGNAIKYGQGKPIQITARKKDDSAVITIQDQGIGIPEEQQTEVFKPFIRAVKKSDYDGLGLGLYVANQIIKAHKGSITIDSKPGKGTSFIIELPLNTVSEVLLPTTGQTN